MFLGPASGWTKSLLHLCQKIKPKRKYKNTTRKEGTPDLVKSNTERITETTVVIIAGEAVDTADLQEGIIVAEETSEIIVHIITIDLAIGVIGRATLEVVGALEEAAAAVAVVRLLEDGPEMIAEKIGVPEIGGAITEVLLSVRIGRRTSEILGVMAVAAAVVAAAITTGAEVPVVAAVVVIQAITGATNNSK